MDQPAAGDGSVQTIAITLKINGRERRLAIEPWVTLLDLLRDRENLTGTKKGCDHGQCGACTVLIDGRRINSCLVLAVSRDGAEITTIEGLGGEADPHPLQRAFMDHDAFQCGYCTPGQICSAQGLINEGRARTRDEVRELMSGNLCRCGAYTNITDAVMEVLEERAMNRFTYVRADRGRRGGARRGGGENVRFLAGGTNLIDLMKENVERPTRLVDINRLPFRQIEEIEGGGLRLGALVTNAETAYDRAGGAALPAARLGDPRRRQPAASQCGDQRRQPEPADALLLLLRCRHRLATSARPARVAARSAASTASTRSSAPATQCIATHPSDMCVALAALDAEVRVTGPDGERVIAFADYHRLPGDEPWRDNTLSPASWSRRSTCRRRISAPITPI